jgi:TPR repeat protein
MRKILFIVLIGATTLVVASNVAEAKKAYKAGNYEGAKVLFEKACKDEKNGQACGMLGVMYNHGQGTTQDTNKAKECYKKACDYKFELGCEKFEELTSH